MRVVKLMKIGKENLRKLEVVSLAFNLLSIRTPSLIQVSLHIISFIVFAATRAFAQVCARELSLHATASSYAFELTTANNDFPACFSCRR